jgi:thiol-disulfide isomerase/thioredoxin
MRIAKLLSAGLVALAFQACNTAPTEGTNIYGTAEGIDSIYVLKPAARTMDTLGMIEVKEGEFSFNMTLDSADFIILLTPDQYNLPLYMNPDEDVKLTITGAKEDREYTVEGSETSERIRRVGQIVSRSIDDIDTLNEQSGFSGAEADMIQKKMRQDSAFQTIINKAQDDMRAMIDEDPASMANVFIFPQRIGNVQLINMEDDGAYYDKAIAAMEKEHSNNKHFKNFKFQVERLRQQYEMQKQMDAIAQTLVPGAPAPDIALPDSTGNIRKLSDLRGKVVLVDFWAAWCRPCRAENPNVVRMYNTYNRKGFEVYSVSLDGLPQQPNGRMAWLQAIEQDGLIWPNHVSELNGWNTRVVNQYGFNGIPFTVLVDREGNIIEKNLRGPALEAKLKEVL